MIVEDSARKIMRYRVQRKEGFTNSRAVSEGFRKKPAVAPREEVLHHHHFASADVEQSREDS